MIRSLLALFAILLVAVPAAAEPINAVIGDTSWERDGFGPVELADEVDRIRTHLLFVADELESRDVSHLAEDVRSKRAELLFELREYAMAGVFPRRTNDHYEGRRPQFIDSRGVHCAVGELMRLSGHEALARHIDEEAEFEYVAEMKVDGVDAWAAEHGFSRTELAMIQPGYGPPPSKESVVAEVESEKMEIAVECGREHGIPGSIMLHLRGNRSGEVRIALAESDTPFGTCFLERLRVGGGAYDQSPRAFNTRKKFELATAQELAEDAIDFKSLARNACRVRPGELPNTVEVRYVANRDFAALTVQTTPQNAEVELCIADGLKSNVRHLGRGNWSIEVEGRATFEPRLTDEVLSKWLASALPNGATDCFSHGAPDSVTASASAEAGADDFEVAVSGGTAEFQACLESRLRDQLRANSTVSRRLYGDDQPTYERYFRIDASARGTATVAIETPEARAERIEAHRREMERAKYDF